MSAPVLASGISVHPASEGQHVVLCLHDAGGSPITMILMSPAEASTVQALMATSAAVAATNTLGAMPSLAVN